MNHKMMIPSEVTFANKHVELHRTRPHGRIAFLACNRVARRFRQNPSYFYRCDNVADYLSGLGMEIVRCHMKDAPTPDQVDAVVFHRPRASWRLRWLLWRYRRAGVATLADVDDLVFDESLVRHSPAIRNARVPLPIQWRIFRLQRRALSWFRHLTVSTDALAGHARALLPQTTVSVLYNSVFWSWRNNPDLATVKADTPPYVMAYMPGTRSHDRDFALAAESLQRFLRDHPDTVLRVTGPLNFKLDVPEGQLVHEGLVPFDQYPKRFQGVWANLAPLEQTPFNDGKSALKALEAGYMGVPTLCSPNPDMSRFTQAGAVVVREGDWYGALKRMRERAYYDSLTEGLRERVLAIASVEEQAGKLLQSIAALRAPKP